MIKKKIKLKTDLTPENHKFHARVTTLVALYQTTNGLVPVRDPEVGDRCSKTSKLTFWLPPWSFLRASGDLI